VIEMNYNKREEIFNNIMIKMRYILYYILKLDKHKRFKSYISNEGYIPVMSVNPKTKQYRFNCYCFDCPCNKDSLCVTAFNKIPKDLIHEFDDDNIIKNLCG